MAAVALFMVGRLAKFNDIFTSTVPTINNFSNHALRINCLTLFVQLKIQNNILFLYTTRTAKHGAFMGGADFVQWHGNYELLHKLAELKQMAKEIRAKHEK